jgi:hypothetical protein
MAATAKVLERRGNTQVALGTVPPRVGSGDVGKGPKNEDDPIGQRWFAKRIADMKWWGENSKPEQRAEPQDQPAEPASEEPQATSEDQQPPTGDEQQQNN